MSEENVVFVGRKTLMNYVLAVITQFNQGASDVVVKARGKAISRAVDVVEIIRNRFLPEVQVKDIKIGTEVIKNEDGRESKVSAIDIYLQK